MSGPAIVFDRVGKQYVLYHQVLGGLKNFLFHLPGVLGNLSQFRFTVFNEVSFEISRGEMVGIIGKNGAGKSTILQLIAQVIRPSSGKVRVAGEVASLLDLGAGFHSDLTGRENALLKGMIMGLRRREILRKMPEIEAFSGLGQFMDQPVRIYSTGMLTRLGFSVIAHLEPEILLVDEVLAVGDVEFVNKCIERIQLFKRRGVTIVLVSHNMYDILRLCDRALWLEDKKVRTFGETKEVVAGYLEAHGQAAT